MEKNLTRPPIVAVLGHVDHGKTTLLDAIRKTSVAAKEAGGITQSIGASQVETKEGKKITFIDTPGHAAFTKMRSRGASVADIAILVVDASDGVKPQTIEALQIIKEAKIPFIVAATKIDLPSASLETVEGQLEKEGVAFEGRGGDVPVVPVSGKTGKGIDELLETISLVAEVHEVRGSASEPLEAVIIETSKDKKGSLATLIVRRGTLKVGELIHAENISCKLRALFSEKRVSVKEVFPGEPASVLGFDELPPIGAVVSSGLSQIQEEKKKEMVKIGKVDKEQIAIILKAKNAGSLEAVLGSLPQNTIVISTGVGDVNESDILLAKTSDAYVISFDSAVSPVVSKLAETEGVLVKKFDVIYDLTDALNELLKKGRQEILGRAEIIATFPYENQKVAGCKVLEGKITKVDNLVLLREEKEVGRVKPVSLKKQKQEILEAKAGEEFGIIFTPSLDFKIGDVLVSVRK